MLQEYIPPVASAPPPSKIKALMDSILRKKSAYSQVSEEDVPSIPMHVFSSIDGESNVDDRTKAEEEVRSETSLKAKWNKVWLKYQHNIAWGIAVCGLLCTAWISPCFVYLGDRGVAAARRASWRSQVLLMLLAIPSFFEYRSLTPEQKSQLLNWTTMRQLLVCGILWLADLTLWSNGLEFTTVPRASIFANSYSLLLVIYYKISKKPVSGMEIFGTVLGFLGLGGAVLGTHFFGGENDVLSESNVYIGDLLCFGSAVGTAAYIINAGPTRKKVSTFLYTLSNTFILLIGLSTISIFTEHTVFDSSVNGLFGWVQLRFFLAIGALSVVAGVIGFNLNTFAVKYVSALAYSLVALCDPIVSGTYAWLIGVEDIPGLFTFIGGGITIFGIVTLLYGQDKRTKQEKLAALQTNKEEGEDTVADGASLLSVNGSREVGEVGDDDDGDDEVVQKDGNTIN